MNLCNSCNNDKGYYPKLYDTTNKGEYINCYKSPDKYYLDKNDFYYKDCYKTCKNCNGPGELKYNDCTECEENFKFREEFIGDKNCYEDCESKGEYYYFKEERLAFCTKNKECPKDFNKFIEKKQRCIDKCFKDNIYKYEFRKKCYEQCPQDPYVTKNESFYCQVECPIEKPYEINETQTCVVKCNNATERAKNLCYLNNINANVTIQEKETLVNGFQELLENGGLDDLIENITGDGKDSVVQDKGATYTFTTTENQRNNENSNTTTINLGDCEDKLRNYYSIPKQNPLLIFKIDVVEEGLKVPKIEYEVYNPKNHEKLSLNVCQNSKVNLSIPINIDESDIDKFNSSSGFYNDICYTYTSDKGTDVSLDDRKNEFIEKNMTVCEENCDFVGYDKDTQKAICSCEVKIKLPLMSEITLDKNKLYESFANLKSIFNVKIMKCYHVLFSKKGLTFNIGLYIMIPIIIMHILFMVLFYKKDYNKIIYKIKEIVYVKKNKEEIEEMIQKQIEENKKKQENKENVKKVKKPKKKEIKEKKEIIKEQEDILEKIEEPLFVQYMKKKGIDIEKEINVAEKREKPLFLQFMDKKGIDIKEIDDDVKKKEKPLFIQFQEKKEIDIKEIDDDVKKKEKPLFLQFQEKKEIKEKQIKKDNILEKKEEPLFIKLMKKKEENKLIDEKEKKNEPRNELKHSPPIKKINIKKKKDKNIEINNLKTRGEITDKTLKQLDKSKEIFSKKNNLLKIEKKNKNDEKKINIDTRVMQYNEYELNTLTYEDAVKEDKRTFIQYYFSLLKTKHLLMFSFYPINDYNSKFIKIDLFLFYFSISYTVNALFFNDQAMHQIYEDGGEYNFIYQIPQIIYSAIITGFLNSFLKILSLTEKNVLEIKHEVTKENLDKKAIEIVNCIYYKYIIFFSISTPFLFFCLYYLGCFCSVYKNTQIHLIKDTLISSGITFLYPIFLYILPGIFRIPSLRAANKDKETMYKISLLIQLI